MIIVVADKPSAAGSTLHLVYATTVSAQSSTLGPDQTSNYDMCFLVENRKFAIA